MYPFPVTVLSLPKLNTTQSPATIAVSKRHDRPKSLPNGHKSCLIWKMGETAQTHQQSWEFTTFLCPSQVGNSHFPFNFDTFPKSVSSSEGVDSYFLEFTTGLNTPHPHTSA